MKTRCFRYGNGNREREFSIKTTQQDFAFLTWLIVTATPAILVTGGITTLRLSL